MKYYSSLLLALSMMIFSVTAYAMSYNDLITLANGFITEQQYEKALACYDLAISAYPDQEEPYLASAMLNLSLEHYDESQAMLDKLLAFSPLSSDGRRLQLRLDYYLSRIDTIEKDLLYAEILGADLSEEYPNLGYLYFLSGKMLEAVDAYDHVDMNDIIGTAHQRAYL